MKNVKRKATMLLALVSLIVALVPVDFTSPSISALAQPPTDKYLHGEDGLFYGVHLHADFLINLVNPICTYWHELWPYYCKHRYHLNSWKDNGDDMLSPSDQIDMIDLETETKSWWHVDDVTVTIIVSPVEGPVPEKLPHLEFTGGFAEYSLALLKPVCTIWHEVYPVFSKKYHLSDWNDNGDGMISPCDYIIMTDLETETRAKYHVVNVATDIIVTRKPVCTQWHEIYPHFCEHDYHLSSWIDTNHDHRLSPCDIIDITDKETGEVTWWHVRWITITIVVTEKITPSPEPLYLELELPQEAVDPVMWNPVLTNPVCTHWHEIWPAYCRYYHLSSWEDNGDGWLSPSDQIDMTDEAGDVHWYHVDDVAIDILITPIPKPVHDVAVIDVAPDIPTIVQGETNPIKVVVEDQGNYPETFDVTAYADKDPSVIGDEITIGTETVSLNPGDIMPLVLNWDTTGVPPETYTISAIAEVVPGETDTLDNTLIDGTVTILQYLFLHGEDGLFYSVRLHADPPVLIDLSKPICTYWHELWPYYCKHHYHLNSWKDNGDDMLSPSDQIDMIERETGEKSWWHVDDVTVTIWLTSIDQEYEPMYIEFDLGWQGYDWILKEPIGTTWHEIWPVFCRYFTLTSWEDSNANGLLDICDLIDLTDEAGDLSWWHVEEVATDIIVTRKPVCTQWHEIYPNFCNHKYHLSSWKDNGDHKLSPCDIIDMTDKRTGKVTWWHVAGVTITIVVTEKVTPQPEPLYLEFYEEMPQASIEEFPYFLVNPVCTYWHEIWPIFSRERHLSSWEDNGDGWLSPCDQIDMTPINFPGNVTWYHVDEVTIDIWIEPIPQPCPPKVEWTHTFGPIDYFMTFCPSPAVANLDKDMGLEIVTGTDEWHGWQRWHCFDSTGAHQWTLPTGCDESRTSVAIGDMDLDGDLEIAGGCTSGWETQVFSDTGSFVWKYSQPNHYDWWHSSPAMCDVNPYRKGLEIIAAEYFSGKVFCFSNTGIVLWTFDTRGIIDASPACADIDYDGVVEVVIGAAHPQGSPHYIYALNGMTGAVEWQHWIQQPSTCCNRAVHSSAAIANIDLDEQMEVIFGANDGGIRCLRGTDGTLKWTYWTHGSVYSSPAIGDVDADGELEIIVGSNDDYIYCLSAMGGLPILEWRYLTGGDVISSAALANRGDVGLAIYIGSMDSKLYALDGTGNLIWSFYTGATNGISSSPAVADIDGDSKLEVMFTDWNAIPDSWKQTNIFWVLEDCTSTCPPYKIEWGMFRHDRCHTGKYTSGIKGIGTAASEVSNTVEGSIKIIPVVHDVAIVFDWLSKTFITAGETVDVYVTVENQGTVAETTNVTVTYDGNFIGNAPVTLDPGDNQTLTFLWDTTGVPKGTYSVTAEASIVPGETETIDNTFSTMAIVKEPVHDIAVAYVKPAKKVVGQGFNLKIEITIINQGDFPETFGVTPSYDSMSIGLYQAVTLNPSEIATITFDWDTTGVAKGKYAIGAYIVTPISGETDLADNTCVDGSVQITIAGDINGDGKVDHKDLLLLASAYGSEVGDPPYIPEADINCSGKVDHKDLLILASNYGKTDP
jgi:hypothetical protein